MRLIDADALIKRIQSSISYKDYEWSLYADDIIDYFISEAPTIDAVEVVRCGDCKHLTADGRCLEFADDSLRPSANDFCSCGERRER